MRHWTLLDIDTLYKELGEFSDKTFGDGQRNPAIVHHLLEEVEELIDAMGEARQLGKGYSPKNEELRMEYADCFLLLFDSARKAGYDLDAIFNAMQEKLDINKTRM